MGVPVGWLEHRLNQLRESEKRLDGETIDAWAARTWHMVLMELERRKDPLPNVVEQQAIQAQRRAEAGLPPLDGDELEQEKEEIE